MWSIGPEQDRPEDIEQVPCVFEDQILECGTFRRVETNLLSVSFSLSSFLCLLSVGSMCPSGFCQVESVTLPPESEEV